MLYRRKILLALVENSGKKLSRTDFQKLLFLFCKVANRDYYDFFPYHYGSFSFLANQDSNILTSTGYLADKDNVELRNNISFLNHLNKRDQIALNTFSLQYRQLRGKSLLRFIYLNYPQYTSKSKILKNVLTDKEIKEIKNWWNSDFSPRLFTLGYEGISIDSYLNKLVLNNIKLVIDVRKNPISMKFGFSKTRLKNYLDSLAIKYIHLPELGIPSKLRKDLETAESYKKLFVYYSNEILPKQLDAIDRLKNYVQEYGRVALTCFEKEHYNCHRSRITEYLAKQSDKINYKITHI